MDALLKDDESYTGPPPEPNVQEVNVDAEPVVEQKVEVEEPVIETLLDKNNYNPPEMDMDGLDTARYNTLNYMLEVLLLF